MLKVRITAQSWHCCLKNYSTNSLMVLPYPAMRFTRLPKLDSLKTKEGRATDEQRDQTQLPKTALEQSAHRSVGGQNPHQPGGRFDCCGCLCHWHDHHRLCDSGGRYQSQLCL